MASAGMRCLRPECDGIGGNAMPFQPRLDILPKSQRLLWDQLDQVPREFTLHRGTAVASHLGHRQLANFDFFATVPINPAALYSDIPFLKDSKIIQQGKNTLSCLIDRDGPVMVSFFGPQSARQFKRGGSLDLDSRPPTPDPLFVPRPTASKTPDYRPPLNFRKKISVTET
jgi:hypothetical protein